VFRLPNENIDLKVDYRCQIDYRVENIVLEITATKYPVKVYVAADVHYQHSSCFHFLFERNGNYVHSDNSVYVEQLGCEGTFSFHTINSADKNYLIALYLEKFLSIQEETNNVFISPNPAGNFVLIEGIENEELHLFDTNGRFINSFFVSKNPFRLDISNISIGVYNVANRNGQLLGRFIKGGN